MRRYYGWTLVSALGLITIVAYGTTQYFFGVLVVPVGREQGWSRAELSAAYALALAVSGLLGLPLGRWVDRHGARAVIALGGVIGGASLFLLAGVHQLWQWDLLWAAGLGLAGAMTLYPVTFTVVANWFHTRLGTAMALLTVLGGLASPIFIPLAGALEASIGWRRTLMVFGALQLALIVPAAMLFVRRHPEDLGLYPDGVSSAAEAGSHPLQGFDVAQAIRRPAFWTLTATTFVGLAAGTLLFAHQIAYMIGRGEAPQVAAALAGGLGLVSLPGRAVFNLLSERLPSQQVLAACQVVQALGVAILAFASSLPALVAYVLVFGAAFGASSPLIASVRAQHFGRRAFARIGAVQGVPALVGAAASPLVGGLVYDTQHSYVPILLTVAALYVLSAGLMALTPRPSPLARSA
jgi:MFS family permease